MKNLCLSFLTFLALLFNYAVYAQVSSPEAKANPLLYPSFDNLRLTGSDEVKTVIAPNLIALKDGKLIRLTGLDFPNFDFDNPGELSLLAMEILKDMVLGKQIKLYQTKDDEWGRTNRMGHNLAHIAMHNDEQWVQGTILTLGLARANPSLRNPEMTEQMYEIEQAARHNQIGLWGMPQFKILNAETLNSWHDENIAEKDKLYRLQIVEGTIKSAAFKGNRYYLNFGDNWRTDFTVSIAPENRKLFQQSEMDPLQWQGKRMRVRGILEMYNGALIEISHPAQIEFLESEENKP